MKKLICIFLSVAMVLSLCACGVKTQGNDEEPAAQTETEAPAEETAKPAEGETDPAAEETAVPEVPDEKDPRDGKEKPEGKPEGKPENGEKPEEHGKKEKPKEDSGENKSDVTEEPAETPVEEPVDETAIVNPQSDETGDLGDAWERLQSLGQIKTESGKDYVVVTIPADMQDEGVTQSELDAGAGETYTSAVLNEDGSVTYTMTKEQHKAMLADIAEAVEEGMKEIIEDGSMQFSAIEHNDDFTVFDAHLKGNTVGTMEGIMSIGFFIYGNLYSLMSGNSNAEIIVNYYNPQGNLIQSLSSTDIF